MEDYLGAPQHARMTCHSRSTVLCQWPWSPHSWIPLLAFKFQLVFLRTYMKSMHLHHPSSASSSHAPTSQIQTSSSLIIVIPYVYTCVYKLLSPLSIAHIYVCAGQTT